MGGESMRSLPPCFMHKMLCCCCCGRNGACASASSPNHHGEEVQGVHLQGCAELGKLLNSLLEGAAALVVGVEAEAALPPQHPRSPAPAQRLLAPT
eukprot:CAMPEP_0171120182 /NCGR_PEP_ID=MMETSP0766_2-20121228/98994_1 /TAXON_ID=439317 /ORGANISM="Gambierdiscus australes, Strain CAWD 149" /LENGTH=95 /DNA_ID=CAMNT_0011582885 /DNA_START=247 /DNA_END=530 /DNA_ORIENTATION=+